MVSAILLRLILKLQWMTSKLAVYCLLIGQYSPKGYKLCTQLAQSPIAYRHKITPMATQLSILFGNGHPIHVVTIFIHAYYSIYSWHQSSQNSVDVLPRAYRPAGGGERACNSHRACTEGEMLAVTKNRTKRVGGWQRYCAVCVDLQAVGALEFFGELYSLAIGFGPF